MFSLLLNDLFSDFIIYNLVLFYDIINLLFISLIKLIKIKNIKFIISNLINNLEKKLII